MKDNIFIGLQNILINKVMNKYKILLMDILLQEEQKVMIKVYG